MSVELLNLDEEQYEIMRKFSKDMQAAAEKLSVRQARYLVDLYYQVQEFRKRANNQHKAADKRQEPHVATEWVFQTFKAVETNVKSALGRFARQYRVGLWMQSLCGIGPVISAGLLAHLDVRNRPHVGHFWTFAGLNPKVEWKKGQKRPWNASLKELSYKIGECIVRAQNLEQDDYGQAFAKRKLSEWEWNFAGDNFAECARILATKDFRNDAIAKRWYEGEWSEACVREWLAKGSPGMHPPESDEAGMPLLPPAHVHARARRWVVKLFLSHVHHVMFEDYHGYAPDKPYPFEHLRNEDHRHYIAPPHWPITGGKPLAELLDGPR